MIRAVRVHEVGAPDVMKIEEIDLPPLEPGEVRIRNHAIGVNYVDIYFRTGAYPVAQMPFIPGNEAAGEIIEVGKDVKGFKVGDRVAYMLHFGAYAEARKSAPRASSNCQKRFPTKRRPRSS